MSFFEKSILVWAFVKEKFASIYIIKQTHPFVNRKIADADKKVAKVLGIKYGLEKSIFPPIYMRQMGLVRVTRFFYFFKNFLFFVYIGGINMEEKRRYYIILQKIIFVAFFVIFFGEKLLVIVKRQKTNEIYIILQKIFLFCFPIYRQRRFWGLCKMWG